MLGTGSGSLPTSGLQIPRRLSASGLGQPAAAWSRDQGLNLVDALTCIWAVIFEALRRPRTHSDVNPDLYPVAPLKIPHDHQ